MEGLKNYRWILEQFCLSNFTDYGHLSTVCWDWILLEKKVPNHTVVFFDIQNNFCTQHVVNLYFSGNSMNNFMSYCGLTDARMRVSEKDLPVNITLKIFAVCVLNNIKNIQIHMGSYINDVRLSHFWPPLPP